MITSIVIGVAAAMGPSCSLGDYISTCTFIPPRTGAFRIVSEARAAAKGPGPHRLTAEYVVNGMPCKQSATWQSGPQTARANCVATLNAGVPYHVVATTNAQNADHLGRVSISITPTKDAPTLRAGPAAIRIKTSG
jgi:hypothetical protein